MTMGNDQAEIVTKRDVPLSRPTNTSIGTVTSLTMREPLAQDLIAAQSMATGNAQQEAALFAIITGLAPEDVYRMPVRDYVSLQEGYRTFLS